MHNIVGTVTALIVQASQIPRLNASVPLDITQFFYFFKFSFLYSKTCTQICIIYRARKVGSLSINPVDITNSEQAS